MASKFTPPLAPCVVCGRKTTPSYAHHHSGRCATCFRGYVADRRWRDAGVEIDPNALPADRLLAAHTLAALGPGELDALGTLLGSGTLRDVEDFVEARGFSRETAHLLTRSQSPRENAP